jgi:hypothetical protein
MQNLIPPYACPESLLGLGNKNGWTGSLTCITTAEAKNFFQEFFVSSSALLS